MLHKGGKMDEVQRRTYAGISHVAHVFLVYMWCTQQYGERRILILTNRLMLLTSISSTLQDFLSILEDIDLVNWDRNKS